MKALDSFTVERLEEIIAEEGYSAMRSPKNDEVRALARIALAAKRVEPVAYMRESHEDREYNGHNEFSGGGRGIALYTTPQLNSPEIPDGWINCSDQMPENSTDVTLFHPEIGVFNGYCWRGLIKDKEPVFFSNSGEHGDGPKQGVTHWMPLPAAPEKTL